MSKPRAVADGIPVYCSHDKIIKTAELIPNLLNPNTHPQSQIELLGQIIRKSGWRNPITISSRSGMIVKGHGRRLAAELEELEEVPVEYQHYASEAEELADLTADNRIAELAEMDNEKLIEVFAHIDASAIDFEQTGYTEEDKEKLSKSLTDAIKEELINSSVQDGDIYIIDGKHRIMCGDINNPANIESLLAGVEPQIMNACADEELITKIMSLLKRKRTAYVIDSSPEYIELIIKKYKSLTGTRDIKCIRDGSQISIK